MGALAQGAGCEDAWADLLVLTGDAAAGRLAGTRGARLAARHLAARLRDLGLRPAGRAGYLAPVEVTAARLTGPVRLAAGGREWRHRRDFAEVAHLSAGGTVEGPLKVVADGEERARRELAGAVVLVPEIPEGFDLRATADLAAEIGVRALLVADGERPWMPKGVFGSREGRIPVLRVRASVARELRGRDGAPVRVELPLEVGSARCANVLAVLPGRRADRAVFLTAHYDHLGDDPGGPRFPGAQDNASGVVAVLAAVEQLVRGDPPDCDVLVAFLTGEESGGWGARALLADPPRTPAAAVNVDVVPVGRATERPLRIGHRRPKGWMASLAARLALAHGYAPQWVEGQDDSRVLRAAGIPTAGLGSQTAVGLHTPDDTPDRLSRDDVAAMAALLADLVRAAARHACAPAVGA